MLSRLEKRRQVVHIIAGAVLISLIYYSAAGFYIIFALFIASLIICFLAEKGKIFFPFTLLFEKLERKAEKDGLRGKGGIFYLLGASLVTLLFSKDIAMASIAILALGDSVSRLVGPYGYLKHPWSSKKFIEGVVAGWIAAGFAAMLFIGWHQAFAAAGVAMFIESLDIEIDGKKVDDNLTIPVVAALTVHIIRIFI